MGKILLRIYFKLLLLVLITILTSCAYLSKHNLKENTDNSSSDMPYESNFVKVPVFSPESGKYSQNPVITISCETNGAMIKYVINGFNPLIDGQIYTDPFQVNVGSIVSAIASKSGMEDSDITSEYYFPLPEFHGFCELPDFNTVFVHNNLAFISSYEDSLYIIDVTNKDNPTWVSTIKTLGFVEDIAFTADHAFMVEPHFGENYESVMEIADISNPLFPKIIQTYRGFERACGIDISGTNAFVADDFGGGLKIINISNLNDLSITSICDSIISPQKLEVIGNYVYVAEKFALNVVDVSDLNRPLLVGVCRTTDYANDIAVSGNYAYIVSGHQFIPSLQVFDISDPHNPFEIANYHLPNNGCSIKISGNKAYIADSEPGLIVFDISNPKNPMPIGLYDPECGVFNFNMMGDLILTKDITAENKIGLRLVTIPFQ